MSFLKSLSAAVAVGVLASAANAAIVASWRVNPVTSPLVPAGARSASLVVTLTGGSLFNVAGIDLPASAIGPGVTYYNQVPFGSDTTPSPALIAVFPDLAFDSYVGTTLGSTQAPSVPGRYHGAGAAQVGNPNTEFNVAWGATPNTGPTGGTELEIARLTVLGAVPGLTSMAGRGEVRDSLSPNTAIPVPDFPFTVPEPMSFGLAALGLGLVGLRRR